MREALGEVGDDDAQGGRLYRSRPGRTYVYGAMTRTAAIAIGALTLMLVGCGRSRSAGEPYLPAGPDVGVERVPADGALAERRAALAAHPDDLSAALELARAYLEEGRRLSDPRYHGYAQAALAPWWELPAPPPDVLVLRATIRQST